MEEAGEGQQVLADNSCANEVPKRWGFRRSTIARREFMEEVGNMEMSPASAPRRGARQARGRGRGRGKGKEAGEARPDSPAPKRGRGGRKSAPANLSSVPSPAPPDTPTTTDFGGSNFVSLGTTQKTAANPRPSIELQAASDIEASSEAAVSDQTEDSDDLTLRELQERARNRRRLEEASALLVTDLNLNTNTVNKGVEGAHEQKQCLQPEQNNDVRVQGGASFSCSDQRAGRSLDASKKDQKPVRVVGMNEVEEEAMQSEDSGKPLNDSSEESDPNAIYCICRQTHNNRFMICCDRCQEWFHGDCVGITEARGRLLEKNGEDYICPTCSPCQSPVGFLKQPVLSRAALSSSSESLLSSSAGEDRPSEDEGIRGKIRKATTQSTKKKFKIFQTVKVDVAVLGREKEEEEKVNQKMTEEKAAAPKCIGPGCFNDALPESVYCGHQCIIRHAAVAMQTITEPKPQPQIQAKPAPKPVPKIQKKTFLEKLFKRKVVEKPVKEDEGSSKEAVVSSPMEEPVAAPLSTDPEPKATGAQESTAIATSVFYKSTTVKEVKDHVENKAETREDAPQSEPPSEPPSPPASSDIPEKEEKMEKAEEKAASPDPPPRKPVCNPFPRRAKKTMPGSPRLAGLKQLQSEPSQGKKSTVTVPEKPTQNDKPTTEPQAQTPSSGPAPEIRVLPVTPAPVAPSRPLQTHPNMQMRQNIRQSLTEALSKRVSESDDLEMSESDVGRLAVNIEREMFNMYYTTDNKYKNKYRTLLLSLKDPRNKGLFYQVMKGYITPFKLTRLSQQELQGFENIAATPLKEDPPPACVNMEEPLAVCEENVVKSESTASSLEEKASASQARPTQPRKVSTAVSDIISSMLKDTTSEHKAHLFDLKCRICTGQISADEDSDAKMLKKEELKEVLEEKPQFVIQMFDKKPPADVPEEADSIMESPASPTAEDSSMEKTSSEFSPMVIPEVSVVSITRRDPRTAAYRPAPPPSVASPLAQAPPHSQATPLTQAPPPAKASPSAQAPVLPQAPPLSRAPPPAKAPLPALAPVPPQRPPLMPAEKEKVEEHKTVQPLPLPPPPPMPKSILMKPSAPSLPRFYTSSGSTTRLAGSHTPGENETGQFLSKQDTVWKGFLNMLNVAKFVTKAYLISGSASAEVLKKDLPDTIHIGGRILPQTVWEYVEKVKTSVTKELSLIRFHPATDEEEVAYVSLFSYFNSRRRFGVVSNICNSIKDLYLIPLSAKESVPSLLLPLEGPGLEEQHPNLILGLAICQKLKRPGGPSQEFDEKKPRLLVPLDSQGVSLPTKPTVPDVKIPDGSEPYDPDIPISTTPPGSPPAGGSPDSSSSSSSSSLTGPSALSSILSVVNPSNSAKTASSSLAPPPGAGASSSNTPLQTILNTLFGNKKQDSDLTENTSEPSPSGAKEPSVSSPTNIDPIVKQYTQTPKDTSVEKIELELDDDDRPYDPEEEYDPAVEYQKVATLNFKEISKLNTFASSTNEVDDSGGGGGDDDDRPYDPEEEYNLGSKVDTQLASSINGTTVSEIQPPVDASEIKNEIAYDPEDETLFEEMQTYLADTNTSSTSQYETSVTLSEQQRLLEELNRQIEEQKRQLEEQEEALRLQRAAVGVSMAHFSVSDALMSPPPCFGREPEEPTVKAPAVPTVNTSRDPRQSRNIRQDSVANNIIIDNDEVNSINEIFMRKQALTQATFLEPSNNAVVQDMSMPEQKLQKDTEISSLTLTNKRSTSIDRKDHSSVKSASELEESTQSSSNEKNQHSDSRKQRHSSKPDNHSSPRRRSRQNDRRSHHEEKSSRASRDEADRYHRRGRRSPERSRRSRSRSRSRDRSRRQDRVSSSQRDRHRHRSTSRHRTRRDQRSPRLRSTQNRRSEQPEDGKSRQKEQSPSRQRRESVDHSTELAQSTKQEASRSAEIQGDELQNKDSENGEQSVSEVHQETENDQLSHRRQPSTDLPGLQDKFSQREQLPLTTNLYQGDISQPGSEQLVNKSLSAQGEHSNKDLKVRNENRDESKVPKDQFAQTDHSELPPQRNRNACSNRQADLLHPGPQLFHSESTSRHGPRQSSENKSRTSRENSLQRDDFWQDESEKFHCRDHPRFERSLLHQSDADQIPNMRDSRGNVPHDEPIFSGQRDEQQSFGSLHSQRDHSLYHEADLRRQLSQQIPQTHREGSSEHEQPFSRNKPLSGPPDFQRRQPPHQIPQTHQEGSLEHERPFFRNQKPLSGPPDMASGLASDPDLRFNREALAIRSSQSQRSNLPTDEAHQISHDSYHERMPPSYGEERGFSNSGSDNVPHNPERYSDNFPSQETESGHQRRLPYRPTHLQEEDFVQPEAEETDFKNNPHQMPYGRRRGSFHEDEAEQVHHHDHAPADFSQRERDIPREIYLREQFRPRVPGDQWRGPPPRVHGPRGPPLGALMTPRGPTAMRPRMPRAPHPERFVNSAPGPNFGPRGPYPRPRMVGDAGTSPNFGPRGPTSRPEMFEGTEPSTNKNVRQKGPSPVSHMFEEESPQDPVFKSRFQGPGMSEGHRPQMFRPRGPPFGPRMFEGPRPGPLRFRHVMGEPRGLCQPRHEVPRGLIDVGGPPHNPDLPHLNDPRDFHGTSDCDPDQPYDEVQAQGSDESNFQNSANESFSNPQGQRCLLGRWTRGQPRIPMSRSPSCNLPKTPQFPDMHSGIRGPHQFDEFGEQATQEEMDGPHFEKSDVYKGSMDCEDDTPTKGPRFNPPRDFTRQKAPSPLFPGLRMPAPRNKETFEDVKPYSPRFPGKIAPTSTQSQRPPGPKGNGIPNLLPRTRPQMVRPQMVQPRLVGPPKQPDVRPLRLSGPLLPTPPGGPIRMQNPRMQRPQGLLARGPNAGINPPRFDDKFNHPQRESSQSLIHEDPAEDHGNEGEESSSQDSSPTKRGKRWRRRPRKREGRNKAARKQRIKERRKSGGEG